MHSFHYVHEAIAVSKALKQAGFLMSGPLAKDIIAELKRGQSVSAIIAAFTGQDERQAA